MKPKRPWDNRYGSCCSGKRNFLWPDLLKEIEWNASRRRWWVTYTILSAIGTECCLCGPGFTLPSGGGHISHALHQLFDTTARLSHLMAHTETRPQVTCWGNSAWRKKKEKRHGIQKKHTISWCNYIFISISLLHQWSSGRSICWLFLWVEKWRLNQAVTLQTKWFSANLLANHKQR